MTFDQRLVKRLLDIMLSLTTLVVLPSVFIIMAIVSRRMMTVRYSFVRIVARRVGKYLPSVNSVA